MIFAEKIEPKLFSLEQLLKRIEFWRKLGDKIVFTNGCFDILHRGHIHLLSQCAEAEGRLIIGLNSDTSVKRLKGESRPLNDQQSRAIVLAALQFTDAIVVFDEDTPENLIQAIGPDILIKGGDWNKGDVVGAEFVESYGGQVRIVPYLDGYSTTGLIAKSKK